MLHSKCDRICGNRGAELNSQRAIAPEIQKTEPSNPHFFDRAQLRKFRSWFPVTERCIYLNHASVAPLSTPVRQRMEKQLQGSSRPDAAYFDYCLEMIASARCAAAQLLNGRSDQIAFLRNTSEGLGAIANGYPWKPGENIVSSIVEFPANLYPWARVAATQPVELRLEPGSNGRVDVDALLSLVDSRTRVLAVSWVQYSSGQRLPLADLGEFCHEREILFVVDAIQGLGALQVDVEASHIDAFAAGAQKFLLGPKGISLLYLSDAALERIRPTQVGWTSVNGYQDYQFHDVNDLREGAVRFEGGALNEVGISGLAAAIDLLLEAGPAQIENHVLALTQQAAEELRDRHYEIVPAIAEGELSGILTCSHPQVAADEICRQLEEKGIVVSARQGRLRLAPHFYNSREEIDTFLAALPH